MIAGNVTTERLPPLRLAAMLCAVSAPFVAAEAVQLRAKPFFEDPRLTAKFTHRNLTAEEAETLTRLALSVMDRQLSYVKRSDAMRKIVNEVTHVAALPVFRRVSGDKGESVDVRVAAVWALTSTADPRAVAILISALEDPSRDVRKAAGTRLVLLTQFHPLGLARFGEVPEDEGDRRKLVATWRQWWKENEGTAPLYWATSVNMRFAG